MNLSDFRKQVDKAVYKCEESVTLTIGEARQIINEAEQMHGGCHDAQNHISAINKLETRIRRYEVHIQALEKSEPEVDKVGALLPGGGA